MQMILTNDLLFYNIKKELSGSDSIPEMKSFASEYLVKESFFYSWILLLCSEHET